MNARSERKLNTCHTDLQNLFWMVDRFFPFKVVEGHRSLARQLYLWTIRRSKKKKGKHNTKPSQAADVYPDPIDWGDEKRMYYFAGVVKGIAEYQGAKIRWGGDWDGDTEVKDQTFNDLGHFELMEEE